MVAVKKKKKRKPLELRLYSVVTLIDLPGVKSKETQAVKVTSPSDASQFMRKGMSVAACGNYGTIAVWKDDDGKWRCEFMRNKFTVELRKFTAMAVAWTWLKEWWPKIRKE